MKKGILIFALLGFGLFSSTSYALDCIVSISPPSRSPWLWDRDGQRQCKYVVKLQLDSNEYCHLDHDYIGWHWQWKLGRSITRYILI